MNTNNSRFRTVEPLVSRDCQTADADHDEDQEADDRVDRSHDRTIQD